MQVKAIGRAISQSFSSLAGENPSVVAFAAISRMKGHKPASRLTHVDNIARVWQKGQPINHSCGILFLPVNKSTLIRCTLQIWEYPSYFWEVFSLECWKPWVEIIVKRARLCGPESRISIK